MGCGCFCYLKKVIGWFDHGDMPRCPYRGIAAVLAGLFPLRDRRFGDAAAVPRPDKEM